MIENPPVTTATTTGESTGSPRERVEHGRPDQLKVGHFLGRHRANDVPVLDQILVTHAMLYPYTSIVPPVMVPAEQLIVHPVYCVELLTYPPTVSVPAVAPVVNMTA